MKRVVATLLLAAGMGVSARAADLVDTAAGNPDFSTLVSAIQAAELVDTLKGPGPFTVFAPTNEAFQKLPEGTLDDLLKPENKEKLQQILKYHVVAGKTMAGDVAEMNGQSVNTVEGSPLPIRVTDGTVMVGPATVTQTDIEADNGVIHVIDTVLLPPAPAEEPPAPAPPAPQVGEAPAPSSAPQSPGKGPGMIGQPAAPGKMMPAPQAPGKSMPAPAPAPQAPGKMTPAPAPAPQAPGKMTPAPQAAPAPQAPAKQIPAPAPSVPSKGTPQAPAPAPQAPGKAA